MSIGMQMGYVLGVLWLPLMSEPKEKTVQKAYRLPVGLVQYIEELATLQILGGNSSAVVRTLLSNAIQELDNKEIVRKHKESRKSLKED